MSQAIAQPVKSIVPTANSSLQRDEESIGISFIKHALYIALSVILTFGIYYMEDEIAAKEGLNSNIKSSFLTVEGNNRVELLREGSEITEKFQGKIKLEQGDTIQTKASSNVSLTFPKESVIRLDENTDLKITNIDHENKVYEIELLKGQAWINNIFNSSRVEIQTGGLKLQPIQAIFNVHKVGSKVDVHVHKHQVRASFKDQNNTFINDFYIAEGNKITAKLNKLNPVLKKLFYSKLIKEFKYGIFNSSVNKNDPWFKQNIDKDRKYFDKIREKELNKISNSGLKNGSINSVGFQFKSAFNENIKFFLTISPDKKEQVFLNELFGHIDDAIYLAEEGQIKESLERMKFFDLVKNNSEYSSQIDEASYKDALKSRISKLIFVSPGDDLYVIKEYLLSERLSRPETKKSNYFPFLQHYLDDVYDSASKNFDQANHILDNYFKTLFVLLNSDASIFGSYSKDVQIQNHFIDNLFLRYPIFYRSDFFIQKSKLEELFLDTIPEGTSKNEERQSLISKKFDVLKRLQYFFFENKIPLSEARTVVSILIEDIKELLPAEASELAIEELFQKRIEDFNLFQRYLNNDEYAASIQHGANHQERYQAFLVNLAKTEEIKGLQKDFLNNLKPIEAKPIEASKEDIIREVKKDFAEIDAVEINFSDSLQDGDRYIRIISARLEGYKFAGVYDREKQLLSDLSVGGNLISTSGVKLKNISPLIESKFAKLKGNTGQIEFENTNDKKINQKEKLLKLLFIKKLNINDLDVKAEQIEILDEEKKSFEVFGLEIPSAPEALYQFQVLENSNKATNIKITTLKHEVNIKEDIQLKELSEKVESAYAKYLDQVSKNTEKNQIKTKRRTGTNSI